MKIRSKYFIKLSIAFFSLLVIVMIGWRRKYFDLSLLIDTDVFNSFGSFAGTIVLIITLYYAYKTYKHSVKNQIESRFFQLIQVVTDTRNELLKIDKDLFAIYIKYINTFYKKISEYSKVDWKHEDILKLAYLYFFYGIIDLETSMYENIVSIGEEERKKVTEKLTDEGFDLQNPSFKTIGIYFRKLYQAVTFIDDRKELDCEEKYRLIKILRVTMNVEEQYLFFINSITTLGSVWELKNNDSKDGLITKYNLIKNIPQGYEPVEGIGSEFIKNVYPDVDYEYLSVVHTN